MKLNNLVMRGGVLVILLSLLVVGCKQSVDSGDPNWTTDEKEKKVWERDNSSNEYVRAFKQFGTSFNVTGTAEKPILAKVELADITTGKAGFVFGLNKYGDTGRYRYFVVGLGGKNYSTTEGDYYISYYSNVQIESLSTSSDREKASGDMTIIVDNKGLGAGKGITGTVGSWYVSVEEDAEAQSFTIKIGTELSEDQKTIKNPIVTETVSADSEIAPDPAGLADVQTIKGGIGAYGMIKPKTGDTAPKAKDTFEVLQFSGTIALHADAE